MKSDINVAIGQHVVQEGENLLLRFNLISEGLENVVLPYRFVTGIPIIAYKVG